MQAAVCGTGGDVWLERLLLAKRALHDVRPLQRHVMGSRHSAARAGQRIRRLALVQVHRPAGSSAPGAPCSRPQTWRSLPAPLFAGQRHSSVAQGRRDAGCRVKCATMCVLRY